MTQHQQIAIANLRKENYSYATIAQKLGLNPNSVKSYCRRHGIKPESIPRKKKAEKAVLTICEFCGTPITNDWNRIGKRFCSDKCRTAYWNAQKQKEAKSAAPAPEKNLETAPESAGLPAQRELSSGEGR